MKIFLSWSGNQSRDIAEALYDWIPSILNSVEPWMSKTDIRAGKQWLPALTKELEGTHFGITCLTPTNLVEPWLLFEAGALAKKVDDAYLCTYLANVQIVDIAEPLRPFQAAHWDKSGTKKLLDAINEALGKNGRPSGKLEEAFELWWPKLEAKLQATTPDAPLPAKRITLDDIAKGVDELLQRSRSGQTAPPLVVVVDSDNPALENLSRHLTPDYSIHFKPKSWVSSLWRLPEHERKAATPPIGAGDEMKTDDQPPISET